LHRIYERRRSDKVLPCSKRFAAENKVSDQRYKFWD
jgi:hypothetical protein